MMACAMTGGESCCKLIINGLSLGVHTYPSAMNNSLSMREAEIKDLIHDLKVLHNRLQIFDLPLDKSDFLTEAEVCELIGVTSRTLRTYRKLGKFHFMKIKGRILFHRLIFYLDILRLHYDIEGK